MRNERQKELHRLNEAKRRAENTEHIRALERERYTKNLKIMQLRRRRQAAKRRLEDPKRETARGRDWRAKNPDKWREYTYRYLYGLSIEEFQERNIAQESKCAICRRIKPLAVDHCHKTGKVRGLLCKKCNLALGYIDDTIELAEAMKCYLEKHS